VAVLEGALLFRLAPEDFVVTVGIERRVDLDEIHARIRQLAKLVKVVAAIDNLGCDQRRRLVRWRRFWRNGGLLAWSWHGRRASANSGIGEAFVGVPSIAQSIKNERRSRLK
jgi:hypothetical protein